MSETATVLIPDPETEEIEEQALAVVEEAEAIEISSDEDYEAAGVFLRRVKAVLKQIAEVYNPIIKRWHEGHKATIAERKKHEAPLLEAENEVKAKMAAFHREQEAERRRIEAEQRRLAREKAEQEALERAAELESEGRTDEAEALITRPPDVAVVPEPEVEAPKAEGVSVRKIWKFRVVDAKAIKAQFLVPDEKKIGQVVRSMGADAAEVVGGIEVYEKEIVAARA